jgi:hypothetical protein
VSCHDYPWTSSASDSGYRGVCNSPPKILGKEHGTKPASCVSVTFLEATGKLSHNVD